MWVATDWYGRVVTRRHYFGTSGFAASRAAAFAPLNKGENGDSLAAATHGADESGVMPMDVVDLSSLDTAEPVH